MGAGLLRAECLRRMPEPLGGATGGCLSGFRVPACSQRFFRALRLPERREDGALSVICQSKHF